MGVARWLLLLSLVCRHSGGCAGGERRHTVGIEDGHFTVDDQPFFPLGFYCEQIVRVLLLMLRQQLTIPTGSQPVPFSLPDA
jgi:hypothetical protein